jgi:hypothetical protein
MRNVALLVTFVASVAIGQQVSRSRPTSIEVCDALQSIEKLDGAVVAVRDIAGSEWNSEAHGRELSEEISVVSCRANLILEISTNFQPWAPARLVFRERLFAPDHICVRYVPTRAYREGSSL